MSTIGQRARSRACLCAALGVATVLLAAAPGPAQIELDQGGNFRIGGFCLSVGADGGFEIRCGATGLCAQGGIYTALGGWKPYWDFADCRRTVSAEAGVVVLTASIAGAGTQTRTEFRAVEGQIVVDSQLIDPDWAALGDVDFDVKIPVDLVAGKRYATNEGGGIYPVDFAGPQPAGGFNRFELAPDDERLNVTFSAGRNELFLTDKRGWDDPHFSVLLPFPKRADSAVRLVITPSQCTAETETEPAVQVCQIGYAPADEKWCVLAVAPGEQIPEAELLRLGRDGWQLALSMTAARRQLLWDRQYVRFDFSQVTGEGAYKVRFAAGESPSFRIAQDVYGSLHDLTLGQYLPLQMCHIEVDIGGGLSHAACHLDDGMQVRPWKQGPDQFVSPGHTQTGLAPGTHIDICSGGWHDAGDYDINTANTSFVVLVLSWAAERYGDRTDSSGIDWQSRKLIAEPNSNADLIEQVAWGAAWLLAAQRADGGVYVGVVEGDYSPYGQNKRPEELTDGLVYDSSLRQGQISAGRSGTPDDREVYTNTTTPNQLKFVCATAAAARALAGSFPELAGRCRLAAQSGWSYFLGMEPDWRGGPHNQPRSDTLGQHDLQLAAAAELYRTTGDPALLQFIKDNQEWIITMRTSGRVLDSYGNWFALPFLAQLDLQDSELSARIARKVESWRRIAADRERTSVFGADLDQIHSAWGSNPEFLGYGATYAILSDRYPDPQTEARSLRYLRWVLGLHPGPPLSFVCGLGARWPQYPHASLLYAVFGSQPGAVPGGVVSGLMVDADGRRLLFADDREQYAQTECTINLAAAYIYLSLHARELAEKNRRGTDQAESEGPQNPAP